MDRALLATHFRPATWRGRAAIAASVLLVVTPVAALLAGPGLLVLLAPAGALARVGFPTPAAAGDRRARLATLHLLVVVHGTILAVTLFLLGALGDFALREEPRLRTGAVAAGFTAVHVVLGAGLLIGDAHRPERSRTEPAERRPGPVEEDAASRADPPAQRR